MLNLRNKFFILYFFLLVIFYFFVVCAYIEKFFFFKNGYSYFFGRNPFVSIVVTSYNYAKYLPDTFNSILAQTYKNYEVIIIEDGSTDNSLQIIKTYTDKYKNFHLYQHEGGINKGLIESMKLGISKAKGNFIAFLESDDFWHKDKLLEIVKMINLYPDAVIISNGVVPFGDDDHFSKIKESYDYIKFIQLGLEQKNFIPVFPDFSVHIPTFSAVTIKKDILLSLDFNTPIQKYLDVYLYKQILKHYPLYYVPRILTFWRISSSGSFSKIIINKKEKHIFIKKLEDLLVSN